MDISLEHFKTKYQILKYILVLSISVMNQFLNKEFNQQEIPNTLFMHSYQKACYKIDTVV